MPDLRHHAWMYTHRETLEEKEAFFNAEMNALVAKNAEQYYRSMFISRNASWNLRDTHMFNTLTALFDHVSHHRKPKVVVWAHNSHIGDARATEMGEQGELNIGQLAREEFKESAYAIGFSTYAGTVTAASTWGGPAERKQVLKALPGSYEALFAQVEFPGYYLMFRQDPSLKKALSAPRLERAIGVIYAPQTERQSHYFHAVLPEQFDAIIHINSTQAVEPLEKTTHWEKGEVAETFPSAY
jgi:erythromycin esterase-like protein